MKTPDITLLRLKTKKYIKDDMDISRYMYPDVMVSVYLEVGPSYYSEEYDEEFVEDAEFDVMLSANDLVPYDVDAEEDEGENVYTVMKNEIVDDYAYDILENNDDFEKFIIDNFLQDVSYSEELPSPEEVADAIFNYWLNDVKGYEEFMKIWGPESQYALEQAREELEYHYY